MKTVPTTAELGDLGPLQAFMEGKNGQPHDFLGHHLGPGGLTITAYRPLAKSVRARLADGVVMDLGHVRDGVWSGTAPDVTTTTDYRLLVAWDDGVEHEQDDPYRFAPTLGEMDLHLFNEGRHERLWTVLGSHVRRYSGPLGEVQGVSFAVWAPRAKAVHVIGDFNGWDRISHPMRSLGQSGVWELFIPGAAPGMNYQFAIRGRKGQVVVHTDPMAQRTEVAPKQAAIVYESGYQWNDERLADRPGVPQPAQRADERLRGPPRLVAAGSELRRPRRAPRQLRQGPRLHARRAAARDGAPLRPLVGLPRHELLRADVPVRDPGRLPLPRGPPAPERDRRHPRLGSRPLRHRRVGPRALRRPAPLRAPGPPEGVAPRVGLVHLRPRPSGGPQLPRRQRAVLVRGVPRRRDPRRRRRVDALPRLLEAAGRVDPELLRRTGEPRGGAAAAGGERHRIPRVPRHRQRRRGVDVLVGRDGVDRQGRPRVRVQVEHGLDERRPALPRPGPDLPAVPPQLDDLRADVCVQRELRPADQPRRGRARQGLAPAQVAGHPRRAARDPARLPGVHVVAPRQAADLHGVRVRPGVGVGGGPQPRLVAARPAGALPGARPGQGHEPHLPRPPGDVGVRQRPGRVPLAQRRRREPQHLRVPALRLG